MAMKLQDPNGAVLGSPQKGSMVQAPNGITLGMPQKAKSSDGIANNSNQGSRQASGHNGSDASSSCGFGDSGYSDSSKLRKKQ